jgi:hypothetical protein
MGGTVLIRESWEQTKFSQEILLETFEVKSRRFRHPLTATFPNIPPQPSPSKQSNPSTGLPIIGPIPSTTSHHELRKFVQGICEEVINISSTVDFSGVPGRLLEPVIYFDPKKYDQLLATAVLNKVRTQIDS